MSTAEQQADWSKAQREAELVGRVSVHSRAEEKLFKTKTDNSEGIICKAPCGTGGNHNAWLLGITFTVIHTDRIRAALK